MPPRDDRYTEVDSVRRAVPPLLLILVAATKDLVERGFKASDSIRKMAGEVGGKPEMAQAGGTDASGVERAFEKLFEVVQGD